MTAEPPTKPSLIEYPDGLPAPRRYLAIAAIWMAMAITVLDGTIANVALPTMAADLNTTEAASIWVVNAYQLAIVACLFPLAARGERLGYRRVYIAGLIIFTLGSLGCALSQSLPALTAARVVQGLGAAGIMSVNPALVRFTYPNSQLGRGIGLNAVLVAVASAIGPTIASGILAVADWRWLFAVNLPIGIAAIAIGLWTLPYNHGAKRPFDVTAAVLNAGAFILLILGVEAVARGATLAGALEVITAVAFGVTLIRRERHKAFPLVPIDLLRAPLFRLAICTSLFTFSAQMLAMIALPFHLLRLGHTAVEIGLLLTPWPIAVGLAAPVAGWLADRYPVGILSGAGCAVFAVGLFLLAGIDSGSSAFDIGWRMVICGAGFGFFQSPNNRAMLGATPRHRSGAAGGMLATARVLGQTIGALAMAILFHLAPSGATQTALIVAAVGAVVAMVFSLLRMRTPPPSADADPAEAA